MGPRDTSHLRKRISGVTVQFHSWSKIPFLDLVKNRCARTDSLSLRSLVLDSMEGRVLVGLVFLVPYVLSQTTLAPTPSKTVCDNDWFW